MSARRLLLAALLLAAGAACLPPQDNVTNVHDLRVLGMSIDPPDILIPECNAQMFAALALASASDGGVQVPDQVAQLLALRAGVPLQFTALIPDPKGNGRELDYSLRACASANDRKCSNEGDFIELEKGTTQGGLFSTTVSVGARLLDDGNPLLLEAISQDTYKGLGGIRVPLVLHLNARDTGEEIYAQKLMVFTCRFFPTMKQNAQPVLPGLRLLGEPWLEGEKRELKGPGPFAIVPEDFAALEEPYVVPSLELEPYELVESWKIAWYTTLGAMQPANTGGSDLVTGEGRHNGAWQPDPAITTPQDVHFWFVVRDGRGGQSWIERDAHWTP